MADVVTALLLSVGVVASLAGGLAAAVLFLVMGPGRHGVMGLAVLAAGLGAFVYAFALAITPLWLAFGLAGARGLWALHRATALFADGGPAFAAAGAPIVAGLAWTFVVHAGLSALVVATVAAPLLAAASFVILWAQRRLEGRKAWILLGLGLAHELVASLGVALGPVGWAAVGGGAYAFLVGADVAFALAPAAWVGFTHNHGDPSILDWSHLDQLQGLGTLVAWRTGEQPIPEVFPGAGRGPADVDDEFVRPPHILSRRP